MIIRNFYDAKLAQASYLIGCSATGEAIVIDPSRDVSAYLEMAGSLGLQITATTETHIHADYLSGTRQLSAATGAKIYLSAEGGPDWQYEYEEDPAVVLLKDGEKIPIGNVSFQAVHTPGHTPEHMAFLLTDHPVSDTPHSLFSGDFVFVGDVGRPDLLEKAAHVAGTMQDGARSLHRSLQKLLDLPDSLLLWPGHGAGSSCGKSLGGSPVTTLGFERRTNWALLCTDEDKFVDEILSGQPEPPSYFGEMKRMNKVGPPVLAGSRQPQRISKPDGQLVNVRSASEIRSGSFDNAIAVPYGQSFTTWAGWVVRYDQPITLIADSQPRAFDAARDLAAIGLDSVAGWMHPSDLNTDDCVPFHTIEVDEIDPDALIVDVRSQRERNESWIPGSIHIPYGQLAARTDEVPKDRKIIVHCAAGGRSPIAYSILRRAGFKDVQELAAGFDGVLKEAPQLVTHG